MRFPAISVIIPVYNVERYITRCICSVMEQTFEDFEVLLVDDQTPCSAINISHSLFQNKQFTRYKIITRAVNGGLGAARNSGIQEAQGKYLFFLDSDDWLAPGALEVLYTAACEKEYEIVAADFYLAYEAYAYPASIFRHVGEETIKKSFLLNHNPAAWNKLYEKRLFTANHIYFPEENQWYEDVATIPLLLAKSERVQIIKQPLLFYYQRADSIMARTRNGNPKLFDIFKSVDRLITNRKSFTHQEWIQLEDSLVYHAGAARLDDIVNIKGVRKRYGFIKRLYPAIKGKLPRWNTSYPFREFHHNYKGPVSFFIKRTFSAFIRGKMIRTLLWSLFIKKETDTREKILISIPTLHMGGAEKVLVNMLSYLDTARYNITLYVFEQTGVFEKKVDTKKVKLIKRSVSKKYLYGQPLLKSMLSNRLSVSDRILKIKMTALNYLKGRDHSYKKYVTSHSGLPYHSYDVAISYTDLTPEMSEFILTQVNAAKKIIWIHNDFNPSFIDYINDADFEKIFSGFDKVVAVSSGAAHSLVNRFTSLAGKVTVVNNILDTEEIKANGLKKVTDVSFDTSYVNLISVGRVDMHVKGYDRIVSLSRTLVREGYRFRWYLVGGGKDLEVLRRQITESQLGETVVLLGSRENPYPYIKACDAFVLTSRFEAYPTVVLESHTLGIPCIVTRNAGCADQFRDITTPLIAENNEESLLGQLRRYLSDEALRNKMKAELAYYQYDNAGILKKIDALFGIKVLTPPGKDETCRPFSIESPILYETNPTV